MKKTGEVSLSDALLSLEGYVKSLDPKRQQLMAYWIKDYVRFLQKEASFDPQKLIRYKRGSIVKVHLGYRIGSEEGGLHYAVVVDIKNAQKSPIVTVIPLTSAKPGIDIEKLPRPRIYLGDEIYQSLAKKLDAEIEETKAIHQSIFSKVVELKGKLVTVNPDDKKALAQLQVETDIAMKEMEIWTKKCYHAEKMSDEIAKMKRGSIALVDQITTISKIRIYDPLYPSDTLNKIRLSSSGLDKLDERVKEFYLNHS